MTKIRDFLLQRVNLLKRPKTNLQIIQQSSLLKYKYFIQFLRQHGSDLYIEVRRILTHTHKTACPVCKVCCLNKKDCPHC